MAVLGIDEVGRGPWAGPLVVGAVVLGGAIIEGLNDSKKLTRKRREVLDEEIRARAESVALGWVTAHELDEIGMSEALKLATRRAVEQIHTPYHEIIIDGTVNLLEGTSKGQYVTTLPKADALIPSVSAASIVAKVARDAYMAAQDSVYPGYDFASHAGYGVAKHRHAIAQLGVTPLHRLSFAPLQQYAPATIAYAARVPRKPTTLPTTRMTGNASEQAAAEELMRRGHSIVERNWRTRWCEIDIVSRQDDIYYFVEVKHRNKNAWGDGLAAITPTKQRQMTLAARMYVHLHDEAHHHDLRLAAVATTGDPPRVSEFLEFV